MPSLDHSRGADSQAAASRLIGTLAERAPKSGPMSRDAAGKSACATWPGRQIVAEEWRPYEFRETLG